MHFQRPFSPTWLQIQIIAFLEILELVRAVLSLQIREFEEKVLAVAHKTLRKCTESILRDRRVVKG